LCGWHRRGLNGHELGVFRVHRIYGIDGFQWIDGIGIDGFYRVFRVYGIYRNIFSDCCCRGCRPGSRWQHGAVYGYGQWQ
jgi:hypothetical protein